jgi:hypothetical protein
MMRCVLPVDAHGDVAGAGCDGFKIARTPFGRIAACSSEGAGT